MDKRFGISCWIGCLMFIIACSSSKTTPNSPYARTIAETQALIETQMQEKQGNRPNSPNQSRKRKNKIAQGQEKAKRETKAQVRFCS